MRLPRCASNNTLYYHSRWLAGMTMSKKCWQRSLRWCPLWLWHQDALNKVEIRHETWHYSILSFQILRRTRYLIAPICEVTFSVWWVMVAELSVQFVSSKQKCFLHNLKKMIFIAKSNYILWSITSFFYGLNHLFHITRLLHIKLHL